MAGLTCEPDPAPANRAQLLSETVVPGRLTTCKILRGRKPAAPQLGGRDWTARKNIHAQIILISAERQRAIAGGPQQTSTQA